MVAYINPPGRRAGACYAGGNTIVNGCIRYIHIALWVRKVVLNELDGGFHFKRPVRSLCIMPEEVSHQADVELFWVKESILVVVNIPPGWCD